MSGFVIAGKDHPWGHLCNILSPKDQVVFQQLMLIMEARHIARIAFSLQEVPLPMWYNGFLDLPVWQLIIVTLVLTHITIVAVTVYLHLSLIHI